MLTKKLHILNGYSGIIKKIYTIGIPHHKTEYSLHRKHE